MKTGDVNRPAQRGKKGKVQPKDTYEYVLLIVPRLNERKKRIVTYVALRTVKEFSHFRYQLIVEIRVEKRTLHLDIQGLRPPELTLPDVGPATFETEIDDLHGKVDVVVRRLQKEVNVFHVDISRETVKVGEKPEARFVDLVTRPEDW